MSQDVVEHIILLQQNDYMYGWMHCDRCEKPPPVTTADGERNWHSKVASQCEPFVAGTGPYCYYDGLKNPKKVIPCPFCCRFTAPEVNLPSPSSSVNASDASTPSAAPAPVPTPAPSPLPNVANTAVGGLEYSTAVVVLIFYVLLVLSTTIWVLRRNRLMKANV